MATSTIESLSGVQRMILGKLTDKWQSAYELRASLATLRALEREGLAKSKETLGSMFSPRVNILWRKI